MASLETRLRALSTRIAGEAKDLRTLINENQLNLSGLATTDKSSLVAAINEVKSLVGEGGIVLNDGATNTTEGWSSQKISDYVTAALDALATGAPTALNTLDELAAALGDDANFAATVTAALGNRLRFDAPQVLTAEQKAQANANLGSASLVDTGNLDTDFVAVFNQGLL